MKLNKPIYRVAFCLLLIAFLETPLISVSQTAYLYYNYNSPTTGGNIGVGSFNNVIYSSELEVFQNEYTFTGISFDLYGNFTNSDYASGKPLSLWYSNNQYFDNTAIRIATASAPTSTTSGNLQFASNLTLPGYYYYSNNTTYSYFYVTVDVSNSAAIGDEVGISNVNTASISGIYTYIESSASNVDYYTVTTSSIFLSNGPDDNYSNVSPNTINNPIGSISVDNSVSSTLLNTLTVTTTGTYSLSDLSSGGFKLWYIYQCRLV